MTDRELLELAAKAAGYTLKWGGVHNIGGCEVDCTDLSYVVSGQPDEADWFWCPLTDDGGALRLAVKLGIHITNSLSEAWASTEKVTAIQIFDQDTDPYAATRRAIVRAAAEIGKEMK